jgi:hypothetical protein
VSTAIHTSDEHSRAIELEYREGVPVLPNLPNRPVVTMELVNRLRDAEETESGPSRRLENSSSRLSPPVTALPGLTPTAR